MAILQPGIALVVMFIGADFEETPGVVARTGSVARGEFIRLPDVDEIEATTVLGIQQLVGVLGIAGGLLLRRRSASWRA